MSQGFFTVMDINARLESDLASMRDRLKIRPNDGLLIAVVKGLGRPYLLWHRICFGTLLPGFAKVADWGLAKCCDTYDGEQDVGPCYRMAVDLYMIAATIALLLAYAFAFALVNSEIHPGLRWSLLGLVVAYSLVRTHELISFIAALHSDAGYQPLALIRAIINTIWHYCEIAIAFGTCYLAWHHFSGDSFRGDPRAKPISTDFSDALYFSFVTMTTLGYGDFSPQTGIGQLIVIVEVLLGFFLLVIVLQRAMSAGQKQTDLNRRVQSTVPLYSVASSEAETRSPIGILKQGTRIRQLSESNGELLVESEDRVVGYISSDAVENLDE